MGLHYENLDATTREHMLAEIESDERGGVLYLSAWLIQSGLGVYPDLLKDAARIGSDDTLANALRSANLIVPRAQRRHPKGHGYVWYSTPHDAADVMACEFNMFYCRGLCSRAVAENIQRLEVYRAKNVFQPRPDSIEKIGLLVDPSVVLTDLRNSRGSQPSFGIPSGPNTGLTLRIPS